MIIICIIDCIYYRRAGYCEQIHAPGVTFIDLYLCDGGKQILLQSTGGAGVQ